MLNPRHSADPIGHRIWRRPLPAPLQRLIAAGFILLLAAINILLPVQAQSATQAEQMRLAPPVQ